MRRRCILVSYPRFPFTFRTLMPSRRLATLAACLAQTGHDTVIRDYGTLETLDRLFDRELRATAETVVDRVLDPATALAQPARAKGERWRRLAQAIRVREEDHQAHIASEIAGIGRLDAAVFDLAGAQDLGATVLLAARLKELAPSLGIIAVGPLAEQYGEFLAQTPGVFDAVCTGDMEASVAEWVDSVSHPETWQHIPNLVYVSQDYTRATPRRDSFDLATAPLPLYGQETYPQLAGPGRIRLFEIEDSRKRRGLHKDDIRIKPPIAVCNEMAYLRRLHGANVFHVTGAGTPAIYVDATAREIISRGQTCWYSRQARIAHADPGTFPTLRASGCEAMAFQVDSGSQWLLDEHYMSDFSVTQAERVLRACRSADIFTVAHFTYPCRHDDHHTRAETLRIIERTKPDAAVIGLPAAAPGSGVRRQGVDFGLGRSVRSRLAERARVRVLREHGALIDEARALRVPVSVGAEIALAAQISGQEGHELQFAATLRRLLFTGDAAGVETVVSNFNRRACAPAHQTSFRPFAPVAAAVGN